MRESASFSASPSAVASKATSLHWGQPLTSAHGQPTRWPSPPPPPHCCPQPLRGVAGAGLGPGASSPNVQALPRPLPPPCGPAITVDVHVMETVDLSLSSYQFERLHSIIQSKSDFYATSAAACPASLSPSLPYPQSSLSKTSTAKRTKSAAQRGLDPQARRDSLTPRLRAPHSRVVLDRGGMEGVVVRQ